jgi:ubiquinone/menaquinone biosynthesis C-methylase UbiE
VSASKQTLTTIQTDFDRIALLADEPWNHNSHYHKFLLSQIPDHCEQILEIGCGTGQFARALAARADKVFAIDLSSQMIRNARERSQGLSNIDFLHGDVMTHEFADNQFDCVATLTTIHHLPIEQLLEKIKRILNPGGVFVCLDLYQRARFTDWILDGVALPASLSLRFMKTGRPRPPREIRDAYAEHEKTDSYPTLSEIARMCADRLPGSLVRRHLFWRYSIVWKKA